PWCRAGECEPAGRRTRADPADPGPLGRLEAENERLEGPGVIATPANAGGSNPDRDCFVAGLLAMTRMLDETLVEAAARIKADRIFPEQLAPAVLRHALPAEHHVDRLRKRAFSVRII